MMFDDLRQRWELNRLLEERQKTRKAYARKISVLTIGKSRVIPDLASEEDRKIKEIEDKISWLRTQTLLREAEKYFVPVPPPVFLGNGDGPSWRRISSQPGKAVLNDEAMALMRIQIRDEKRDIWDRWSRWVPLIFGLIGAITGLVAIIRHP